MKKLKHLPEDMWPEEDHEAFQAAYAPGDIFDESGGAGAHLSEGTRRSFRFAWRRWLGFLKQKHPGHLYLPPAERVTPWSVQAYVQHLQAEVAPSSVATTVAHLYGNVRIIVPDRDWSWLRALKSRLEVLARPEDRFDRLVPALQTLDLGITLMDEAATMPPGPHKVREICYRDGLIVAVLSLWPIRRRSLAALTVDRHLHVSAERAEFRLFPEDTKSKRAESWPVPAELLPYLKGYLRDIRPRLMRGAPHQSLWVSWRGGPLQAGSIYALVRERTEERFGKPMALHDFRRAAATFLAMERPEEVGLTPGILQHAGPDVADRHYNLSRGVLASRRHAQTISSIRSRLRSGT